MLSFARKRVIAPRPVAVNDLIRDAEELLRRACGGAVQVGYDLERDPWRALADPTQLELALLNLVTNPRRDAMPDGGSLTFITRNVPPEADLPAGLARRDYVMVAVTDTGSAMHAKGDQAQRVRTVLHDQGSGARNRSWIVDGARFRKPSCGRTRRWTANPGAARPCASTCHVRTVPSRTTRGRQQIRRVRWRCCWSMMMPARVPRRATCPCDVELGHNVTEAQGGEQALELLRTRQFDLLVADFAMPGMNGAELADAATRLMPDLPIVFVTGYAGDDMLRSWIARGCRIVEKPLSLAEKIAAVLRRVSGAMPAS